MANPYNKELNKKTILNKGTRSNKSDSTVKGTLADMKPQESDRNVGDPNDYVDRVMYLMELNRRNRSKKPTTSKGRLQGLFGGSQR